ncbi:MAG: NADPH-dependent F420 reductase [Anaerolineaceae bacterium]|jgi:predicted dinucleotide-binding enzyme
MKIGIIGTGHMGSTLGKLWAEKGHQVFFGSRQPQKAQELASQVGHGAQGGAVRQAAESGEVLLFGVPWKAARETLQTMGIVDGKVLIEFTNGADLQKGPALGYTTSIAEQIAAWAPGARVVNAFNSIHYATLLNPNFNGQSASLFYCGDDPAAKAITAHLGAEIGLDPVDCGPLWMARQLEPLAFLWIYLAFAGGQGPQTAFKWLKR